MPSYADVADLVAAGAADRPGQLAVVEAAGRGLTWAELDEEVSRIASGLAAAGVVAGHRVLICLGNRLEFVTSYLGVLRAQVVAVPVNPLARVGELARMIGDSGSRVVVADGDTVDLVRGALALLAAARAGEPTDLEPEVVERSVATPRVHVVDADPAPGELSFEDLRAAAPTTAPPMMDPDRLACLLYTSGTSGRPRAAMLTHAALLANIDQVAAIDPPMIRGDDVVLGVLPLFHVYGLNAVLGGVLHHRAKLVLVDRFDPQDTLDLIDDEAISVVPVAPAVFARWLPMEGLAERLGPVRLVVSGSAPLSAEVVDEFTAVTGIPVHQGYGLTEAAPVVTSTLCSRHPESGSVGAALPGVELRLVDEAGRPYEGEDPGQIQIRGANLFSGYWPDGSGGPEPDGWWATGDVGILDADGDLFLVDRVRELVIVSGFNVYPHEVEQVLREVDGVAEAAVIGVDDARTGEAVVAYVRPREGTDPGALEDAVRAHAAERLARFKRPSRIEIVDSLPVGVTGKVQKGRLRTIERRRALGLLE